jgi:dihydrofolate reductase
VSTGRGSKMRNLIFAINVTLDGCCDHTKVMGTDEVLEYHTRLLHDVDLLVFGRKTYQLMVPFWPDIARSQSDAKPANDYATAFDSIKKLVISRSLDSVADKNSRIARGELRDAILGLKQEPGKDILTGGVAVPTQLMELGLIDEYRVLIQPIVVGEGRRLFDGVGLQERLHLKLIESKSLNSGVVALRYMKQ